MNVSIPGWVFLSVAMFLLFIMVFVATGSIDDLRMRENYSSVAEKPQWAKEPAQIIINQKRPREQKKSLQ